MSSLSGLSCHDLKFRWKIEPIRKEEEKLKVQIRSEEAAIQRLVAQRETLGEKSSSDHESTLYENQGTTNPPGALKGTGKADDSRQETVLRLRCERRRKKLACLHAKKLDILWSFVKEWLQGEVDRLSVETCLKNNRSVCRLADYYTRYPKEIVDEEELWRRAEQVMSAGRFTVGKVPNEEDNSGSHDPTGCGEFSLDEDSSSQTSSIDILDSVLGESADVEENRVEKQESIPCGPSTSLHAGKQEHGRSPKKSSGKRRTREEVKMNINSTGAHGANNEKKLRQASEDDEIPPWVLDSEIRSSTVSNEVENGYNEGQGAEASMMYDPMWMTKYIERVAGTRCPWEFNDDAKADWEFARRMQLEYETEDLAREESKAFIDESANIGENHKSKECAVRSLNLTLVEEPQVPVYSDKVQYSVTTTSTSAGQIASGTRQLDWKSAMETNLPICSNKVVDTSPFPRRPTYAEKTRSRSTYTKDHQLLVCSDRVQQTATSASAPPGHIIHAVTYQPRPHNTRGSKYPKSPRFLINRAGKSRRCERPSQGICNGVSTANYNEVDTAGTCETPSGSGLPVRPGNVITQSSSNAINPCPNEHNSNVKVSQTEPCINAKTTPSASSCDGKTSTSKPNNDAEASSSTPNNDAKRSSSAHSIGEWMFRSVSKNNAEVPPSRVPVTDAETYPRAPSDGAIVQINEAKESTNTPSIAAKMLPTVSPSNDEIDSLSPPSKDRELFLEELEPPSGVSSGQILKVREESVSQPESAASSDFTISFILSSTGVMGSPRKTTDSTCGSTTGTVEELREYPIGFVHNPLEASSGNLATGGDKNSDEKDSNGNHRPDIPPLDLSKLSNSSPEPKQPGKIGHISETYDGAITHGNGLERCTVTEPPTQNALPVVTPPCACQVDENYQVPCLTKSHMCENPFDFVFHGCVTTSFPTAVMPNPNSVYSLARPNRLPSSRLGNLPSNHNDGLRPMPYNCFRPFSNSWLGGFSPTRDPWGCRDAPLSPTTPRPPQWRAPGQVLQRQWCPNEAAANHIKHMLRISNERCFGYQHRHPAFQQIRSGNPFFPWTPDKGLQNNTQFSYTDLQRICLAPLSNVQKARATGDAPCPIHSFPTQYLPENHALHSQQRPWPMDRADSNGNSNMESSVFFPSSSVFESSLGI